MIKQAYQNENYTISELTALQWTKGRLFENAPNCCDYALPQEWLTRFADWVNGKNIGITYHLILATTLWDCDVNRPVFACTEIIEVYPAYLNWLENQ